MLLRAALLYCLAAFSFIFAAATVWGRFELSAVREASAELAQHVQQLQKDLDGERLKVEAAERRALVAEDSLQRSSDKQAKFEADASETRMKFAAELAAALRDRDAAKAELTKLSGELENARGLLRVAEKAAAAARADADQARSKAEAAIAAAAVKPAKPASRPTESKDAASKASAPKSSDGTAQETPKAPPTAPATGNAGKTSAAPAATPVETSSVAKPAIAKPAAAASEKPKVGKPAKADSAQAGESKAAKPERKSNVRPASPPELDTKGFIQF